MSVLTALVVLVGRQALIILPDYRFATCVCGDDPAKYRQTFRKLAQGFHHHARVLPSRRSFVLQHQVAARSCVYQQTGGGVGDQLIKVMSLVSRPSSVCPAILAEIQRRCAR